MAELTDGSSRLIAAGAAWQTEAATLRHRAAAFWVNVLFATARRCPWFARATTPFWIEATWRASPEIRATTLANAKWLLGASSTVAARRRLARRVIANFLTVVTEIGESAGRTRDELLARIESVEGAEHHQEARNDGRGLIIATIHLGSFEAGVAALRAREPRVHIVFQRDRYAAFERLRSELHRRLDVIEAPVDDGIDVWMQLRDALSNNEVVLMQADRVMPGQKGAPAILCGGEVLLPTGPARLAAFTGAPILPVFAIRAPRGRIRLCIEPAIRVKNYPAAIDAAMAELARVIEKYITAWPEQWLMIHRVWREDQRAAGRE